MLATNKSIGLRTYKHWNEFPFFSIAKLNCKDIAFGGSNIILGKLKPYKLYDYI